MTDDYGIVTEADIRENRKIARPVSEGEPLLVWFCLPVEHFETWCDDLGWVIDLEERGYYSRFSVVSGGNEYSFTRSKFSDREVCIEDKKDWTRLIKGQTACFSAFFIDESLSDDPKFKKASLWNIERVKSRKGEWTYSDGI
jgi:hypothetical protein